MPKVNPRSGVEELVELNASGVGGTVNCKRVKAARREDHVQALGTLGEP